MNNSPIIFCHYGNSNYLEYTLKAAKINNPKKEIYLLGDISNLSIANKIGISHILFNKYDKTETILDFNKKFRFIAGNSHGRSEWTKFVFLRWFYINEFILQNGIDSFWHFDSDNIIAVDLSVKEIFFKKYDNTEQCGGICLNGFISSSSITQLYIKHILDLFSDEEYLGIQKMKCLNNENFAFTEMAAYNSFKKLHKLNTIRFNNLEYDDTFDDCIAMSDGMEQTIEKFNNYHIKEIYFNKKNELFFRMINSDRFIKVNSINHSWMPFYVISQLFYLSLRKKIKFLRFLNIFRKNEYSKINLLHYSIYDKLINKIIIISLKFNFY
jgi:hypothetical protein